MNSHKVNTNYNLERVTVQMITGESNMEFELISDGVVIIGKHELWTVFNVLASDEFKELCHHINAREDAYEEAAKAYGDLASSSDIDASKLYDYGHYMKRYGFHKAKASDAKEAIIKKVGWNAWVDSARVYESISRTPREWLD